jgi:hypothetical protein
VLAVLWAGFELVNVCWPRVLVAPPGAPWYQVWAPLLGTGVVLGSGAVYLVVRRPQEEVMTPASVEEAGQHLLPSAGTMPSSK